MMESQQKRRENQPCSRHLARRAGRCGKEAAQSEELTNGGGIPLPERCEVLFVETLVILLPFAMEDVTA